MTGAEVVIASLATGAVVFGLVGVFVTWRQRREDWTDRAFQVRGYVASALPIVVGSLWLLAIAAGGFR